MVDASGNLDIIEIKKPFDNCLLAKRQYRNNYVPKAELSGAIMQAEKYLFHLSKWGRDGEKKMTQAEHKKRALPEELEIKVTNPKAMILAGRSITLTREQRFDFEIIKRKYANIVDIITYDDLLNRLESIIKKFQRQQ